MPVAEEIGEVLMRRRLRLPLLRPIGKSLALASAVESDPTIDAAAMAATVTISTPDEDHSEDVVEPLGIHLERYKSNPVVFFNHGLLPGNMEEMPGLAMPIAKSEDPDGNLTVFPSEKGIVATSYFSQSLLEASQVFELIAEKIIRGASVRMDPLVAKVRSKGFAGRPGLHVSEWDLLEWSWVGIPDNPYAVRKLLDKNRLAGKAICEPILKSLQLYADPLTKHGVGWTPQGEMKVAKEKTKAAGDEEPEDKPTADDPSEGGKPADPPKDETKADDASDAAADTDDGPPAEMPLGAQVTSATIASMRQLSQTVLAACGPMENERVKEALTAMADEVEGRVGELEAMYGKEYPDFKMDGTGGEEEPTPANDEAAMRKFLAGGRQQQLRVSGIAAKLTRLGLSKALKQSERDEVNRMAGVLKGLVDQAKAAPAAAELPPPQPDPAVVKLREEFAEIKKQLTNAIPHRRAS